MTDQQDNVNREVTWTQ